jgi:hypothetical protein
MDEIDLKNLPLNQRTVAVDNENIRVAAIRTSTNTTIVTWQDPETNRELLRTRVDVFTGHTTLESYDRAFWHISIDGLQKTASDLDRLTGEPLSMHADPSTRSLEIRTKK